MVSPGLLLSATPPRATPPAHRVTAGSVQGSTPTSSFANLISFIKTKGWTITDTKVWAEPLAVKVADPELGEEKVRADSWSGRFKSPWLRLVLDKEGCVEASPQPESVSVCVCVCPCFTSSGKPSSTEEGSGLGLINTSSLATYTSVSLSLWGPPLTRL